MPRHAIFALPVNNALMATFSAFGEEWREFVFSG